MERLHSDPPPGLRCSSGWSKLGLSKADLGHDAEIQRLQLLLDSQPWGVLAVDPRGQVVAASGCAQAMLGRPIIPGVSLDQLFERMLTDGDPWFSLLEQGVEVKMGNNWLWLKLTRVDYAPGVDAWLTMVDITPLRSALDEQIASLRFLLHDLRSPQNSIIALTRLYESDPETFERCGGVRRIGELAHYVLMLSENFIFSSQAGSEQQGGFSRFDMHAVMRELMPPLETAAIHRNVLLHWVLSDDPPRDAPVWVNGWPAFATRAIQNLVDNAIQVSQPGARVTVSLRAAQQTVDILVKDWAGGLPGLAQQGRIESFDELARQSPKGFGLGLIFTVQIVKLHGGALYAESNQGLGTTFVMRLPRLICDHAAKAAVANPRQPACLDC